MSLCPCTTHFGQGPVLSKIQLLSSITPDSFRQTQLYLTFSGPTRLCFKISTLNLIVLKMCYVPPCNLQIQTPTKGRYIQGSLKDWIIDICLQSHQFPFSLLYLQHGMLYGKECCIGPLHGPCSSTPHSAMVGLMAEISGLLRK